MKSVRHFVGLGIAIACALAVANKACATVDAIEYYHAGFDHYFVTAFPEEAAALDNGTIRGWVRTGQRFAIDTEAATGSSPVCRFFSTSFDPKSSHFYTANPGECTAVKGNPNWRFEAIAFYVKTPAGSGMCTSGSKVYRLYNNGKGGAPNHRYTTSATVRATMMSQGWIPEGNGVEGVVFCTSDAAVVDLAYAKSQQLIGGTWSISYTFGSAYTDTFHCTSIETNTASNSANLPYYVWCTNKYQESALATWAVDLGRIILVSKLSTAWDVYLFDFTSANAIAGCYYFDYGQSNPYSDGCTHPLTGIRLGTNVKIHVESDVRDEFARKLDRGMRSPDASSAMDVSSSAAIRELIRHLRSVSP